MFLFINLNYHLEVNHIKNDDIIRDWIEDVV